MFATGLTRSMMHQTGWILQIMEKDPIPLLAMGLQNVQMVAMSPLYMQDVENKMVHACSFCRNR